MAVAFLREVRPSGFRVLVAIDPELRSGEAGKIETRSFAAREEAELAEWVGRRNGDDQMNVYWTVNAVARPLAKKPAREDVDAVEFLHVDVDPDKRRPLAEERARLHDLFGPRLPAGVPAPSILIDSGGGLQGFWRLAAPMPIGGSPERYEEAARYNQQLEVLFGADACHNVDRIMRLPGTVNWPDARKRAAGRAPALAAVIGLSATTYPLTAFTPAPAVQQPGVLSAPVARLPAGNIRRLASVDELPESVPGVVKVLIVQGHDPDDPGRWPSRSEPLFWVVCELVRCGVPDETIFSIITDRDFGISASVLDKGSRAERYALQQIAHARERAISPELAEMNQRHAVIGDLGGRCRVISEGWDPVLERHYFSVQAFEDLQNRYSNRTVAVQGGNSIQQVPLGRWWLAHPSRRQYERMVFAPGKDVEGAYNLWRGFACEARPGDCSLYLAHVMNNICSGNRDHYEYLTRWMARAVQQPGAQAHTAIVMRGERGVGKGVFATGFGELFGRHFFPITSPTQVFGDFNEHLMDTVLLYADEAFFAGDKRNEAVLKGLITEGRRTSQAKYRAAETTRNCLHIIMAANNDWVVPAGAHERRYLVLQVSDGSRQSRPYFGAIERQMTDGGREALLHHMLTMDLSGFDPRDVPRTSALQEQKEHSLGPEEEWWYAKLRSGELREGQGWPEWIACSELLFDFTRHMQSWGRGQRTSMIRLTRLLERAGVQRRQLGRRVQVLTEDGEPRLVDRPRVYCVQPLVEARAAWARLMGGEFDWGVLEELEDRQAEEPYA